jgi:hypothetical protein
LHPVSGYRFTVDGMHSHDDTSIAWVPDACTLPSAERPLRLAEFDRLFATSMRGLDRLGPDHIRLHLDGGDQVETTARDLAARETRCCSFFTFTIERPNPQMVTLDVTVPAGHVAVLDALADRATAARRQR